MLVRPSPIYSPGVQSSLSPPPKALVRPDRKAKRKALVRNSGRGPEYKKKEPTQEALELGVQFGFFLASSISLAYIFSKVFKKLIDY